MTDQQVRKHADSVDGSAADDVRAQPERVSIPLDRLAVAVLAVIVAFVCAWYARKLADVVGLVIAGVVLAVTTLPIQRGLQRVVGRALSIVATALVTVGVCLTIALLVLRDLSVRTDQLATLLTQRLDQMSSSSLVGRIVGATRLDSAAVQWLDDLPSRVVTGAENGGQLVGQTVLFLTVVVLAAFLQAGGHAIIDAAIERWPRERDGEEPRKQAHALVGEIDRRGFGYFRRSLLVAAGAALLVGGVGVAVGLPGAIAAGIWLGAWSVVPVVGKPVSVLPVVLLIALDQRPVTYLVVAAAGVALVLTHIARTRWIEPCCRLGALHAVAVAIGMSIAGFGGSVVVLALAATVAVVAVSENQPGQPDWWRVPADRAWRLGTVTLPSGWRLGVLASLLAVGGVAVWTLFALSGRALVWLAIAGFIAIALSRPVNWLHARTRVPRTVVADVLCVVIGAVVMVAMVTGAGDGARATTTLTERLPSIVGDLERAPLIGGVLRQADASNWVAEQMQNLPSRFSTGRPADWMPFLGNRIVDVFWVLVLAVVLLTGGAHLVDRATRVVPARHRRQWTRLIGAAGVALTGYAAGAATVAAINASVIFVIAIGLGLGLAPVLALWGFFWNFVPQIGGFMGGLPLIVFAFVLGPGHGLIALLAFFAYQMLENHVIQPSIVGSAIDVPPWGTLIAAVAGAAAGGIVGAVVLTPLVGIGVVVRRELASDDFPGLTAQRLSVHEERDTPSDGTTSPPGARPQPVG